MISWVVPAAVAVIVISGCCSGACSRTRAHRRHAAPRRRLMSFVAGEYTTAVCATATTQLMPLIVVWRLGPAQVAYFTLPWLISMGITLTAVERGVRVRRRAGEHHTSTRTCCSGAR